MEKGDLGRVPNGVSGIVPALEVRPQQCLWHRGIPVWRPAEGPQPRHVPLSEARELEQDGGRRLPAGALCGVPRRHPRVQPPRRRERGRLWGRGRRSAGAQSVVWTQSPHRVKGLDVALSIAPLISLVDGERQLRLGHTPEQIHCRTQRHQWCLTGQGAAGRTKGHVEHDRSEVLAAQSHRQRGSREPACAGTTDCDGARLGQAAAHQLMQARLQVVHRCNFACPTSGIAPCASQLAPTADVAQGDSPAALQQAEVLGPGEWLNEAPAAYTGPLARNAPKIGLQALAVCAIPAARAVNGTCKVGREAG